jgi:moderate conductance mechanosensitive channel
MRIIRLSLLVLIVGLLIGAGVLCAANESTRASSAADSGPAGQLPIVQGESRKAILTDTEPPKSRQGLLWQWLRMLDRDTVETAGARGIISFGPEVPGDLVRVFRGIGNAEAPGFFATLARSLVAIGIGFLLVWALTRLAGARITQLQQLTPPSGEKFAALGTALLRAIPALLSICILSITAIATFLLIAGETTNEGRMLFQSLLGIVVIIKFSTLVGRVIFAPDEGSIRPVEIAEVLVKPMFQAFVLSIILLLCGLLVTRLVYELGARPQTVSWVVMIVGSFVLAVYGALVVFLKTPVTQALQEQIENRQESWFQEQLARLWHVPALFYLFILWIVWLGREITGTVERNGVLTISVLIVPLYFILNHYGKVLITAIVDSLEVDRVLRDKKSALSGEEENQALLVKNRATIIKPTILCYRLLVLGTLVTWIATLWGYHIPFAGHAVLALFESLVVLGLALLFWRFASAYITRKIREATPENVAKEDDIDDEFGGAVSRGRSHTLLPLLRKFVGTVLVVMVALIIIAALGVNIGPLLAGAGVIGLAVGFGAQKLVCDVLSGFFLLLDDAFRIGEYIQAGSIRGTVEAITLRNVMLRHHLGMLQIVPYSDLGAITNYMRGGIVMKFPLEFSYDTDIDKVRKIIKKVGVEMLEDPNLHDGFIQPLKSQGVNEITNSVMVIRVKFTAKPGKQFLIKREAFRRITEALAARGIHYAHRKVIVDFPEDDRRERGNRETEKKLLEGAAAAVITTPAKEPADKKAGSAMDDF